MTLPLTSIQARRPEGNLIAGEMFLFNTQYLLEPLDALDEQGEKLEDYGHDLIPWFVDNKRVAERRLDRNSCRPGLKTAR